jgi:hypothetical protein
MPLVPPYSEIHGVPFDLFDDAQRHWGQIRLSQYGQAVTLEVKTDRSGVWKDFQAFHITDGKLMFGAIHAKRQGG